MRLILQSRRYAFTDELGLGLKVRIEGPVRQPGVTHDSGESGSSDALTAKAFGRHLHDPAARCIFPTLFVTQWLPFSSALSDYIITIISSYDRNAIGTNGPQTVGFVAKNERKSAIVTGASTAIG